MVSYIASGNDRGRSRRCQSWEMYSSRVKIKAKETVAFPIIFCALRIEISLRRRRTRLCMGWRVGGGGRGCMSVGGSCRNRKLSGRYVRHRETDKSPGNRVIRRQTRTGNGRWVMNSDSAVNARPAETRTSHRESRMWVRVDERRRETRNMTVCKCDMSG